VVGEDLGTVEDHVRSALIEAGLLSYRLAWFEPEPPERYPSQAMAAVTTHDLPTIAGAWTGRDDADQRAAGIEPDSRAMDGLRRRLLDLSGRPPDAPLDDLIVETHARLAAGPSALVTATLEDGLAVSERPNLPGTTDRRNWSLALPIPLEDALANPLLSRMAAALDR
jgi:4-alpha-glucanotransferase